MADQAETAADAELELEIERAQLRLALAKGKRARERCWNELMGLSTRRSPEQVQRLEREKGRTQP